MNGSVPRVNWGHGRLRSLESIASFSATFCNLNGICLLELSKFLKGYLDVPQWPPSSLDAHALRQLCALLDESEEVVASVISPLAWQNEHPILREIQFGVRHDDDLHFCPECVAQGYHSALHEVSWLSRCPIHRASLSRSPVAAAGGNRFHLYCGALTTCLSDAKTGWPQSPTGDDIDWSMRTQPLIDIVAWTTRSMAELARLGEVIWVAGQQGVDIDRATAVGIMEALAPAPTWFDQVAIPHQTLQLNVEHFDASALTAVQSTGLAINELCWLYRLTNLTFRRREIEPRLLYLNNWLTKNHRKCKCAWAWSRYSGWSPLRLGDTPPWGSVCPYDKLSQELRHAWQCDGDTIANRYRPSRVECVRVEHLSQRLAQLDLISQLVQRKRSIPGTLQASAACYCGASFLA